jgi:hypothetical protein
MIGLTVGLVLEGQTGKGILAQVFHLNIKKAYHLSNQSPQRIAMIL